MIFALSVVLFRTYCTYVYGTGRGHRMEDSIFRALAYCSAIRWGRMVTSHPAPVVPSGRVSFVHLDLFQKEILYGTDRILV